MMADWGGRPGDRALVCEFEFFEDAGMVLAFPFDGIANATEGYTLEDAIYMASDVLRMFGEECLAGGRDFPPRTFGHEPENGGIVIAVSAVVNLDDVPAVTAADAARRLGVSTARVSQLCREGKLQSWRVGATRMVSEDSIEYRLATVGRRDRTCSRVREEPAFPPEQLAS